MSITVPVLLMLASSLPQSHADVVVKASSGTASAGHPVEVAGSLVTNLDAPARAVLQAGDRLYILRSEGTLEVWARADAGWRMTATTPMPEAVGLFAAGNRVWAEIHETRAEPVDAFVGVALAGSAEGISSPTASAVTSSGGHVLSVGGGTAVIDFGSKAGLQPGVMVRFLQTVDVEVPRLDGVGVEKRKVEEVSAVGRVSLVEEEQALVELWRGGRSHKGDRVEVRDTGLGYLAAPERLGGIGETGIVIRPLLALDTVGVAFVNEAWTTWSFEKPWYVSGRLAPLGVGWSKDGNPILVSAVATGGYENRFFSVGLGAGWTMLNGDPTSSGYAKEAADGFGEAVEFKDVDNAFSIVQEARLGARDGVFVSVRNTFILYPVTEYVWREECNAYDYKGDYEDCYDIDDQGSEFVFGGIAMRFGIPVGERTDVMVDWGLGKAGAIWVEGGVSTWLRGNGDKGSLALEVGAGFGELQGAPEDESISLYGPLVSVGAKWRW
jgi:hypothetical protein